jgi:hypothetical protein
MTKPSNPMPSCRHCGARCEAGRHPTPDRWRCNACGRWQYDRVCYACGHETTATNVEIWQARRPDVEQFANTWAAGSTGEG